MMPCRESFHLDLGLGFRRIRVWGFGDCLFVRAVLRVFVCDIGRVCPRRLCRTRGARRRG